MVRTETVTEHATIQIGRVEETVTIKDATYDNGSRVITVWRDSNVGRRNGMSSMHVAHVMEWRGETRAVFSSPNPPKFAVQVVGNYTGMEVVR